MGVNRSTTRAHGPRVASALRYGDFTVFRLPKTIPLRLNLFWLAVVCCVVAQIEIVRSAFKAPAASDGTVPAPSRWTEVLWTVVPAIGLALVLAFTWRAIHARQQADAMRPATSSAVIVEQPS
jgi:heme/copper-type cytochrome/quinol oxidase subunit 2